jgi:hypothetical protein
VTLTASTDEIEPLLTMCRAGRLFDVQDWVRRGQPIALLDASTRITINRTPLGVAIESGFHSLAQVLLEAGAPTRQGRYNALEHAVSVRRAYLAALLIEHGAKVDDVDMCHVVDNWEPAMVELFLANHASLVRSAPIAYGLIEKIRPVLGLLKRRGVEQPELMRQADVALRHHVNAGSPKWVALLLWAGASPWSRGPDRVDDMEDDVPDDEAGHLSAAELAVIGGKPEILAQKKLLAHTEALRPDAVRLLETACHAPSGDVLALLLARGYRPSELADHGTSAIMRLLHSMSFELPSPYSALWPNARSRERIDSSHSRERLRMLHMLVAHGARWLPSDRRAIGSARQSLLKMSPAYVLEFTWLMREYRAARKRDVEELLRTPAVTRLLAGERERADRLAAGIPDDPHDARSDADGAHERALS